MGYQCRLNAEGILGLRPTLVIGREDVRPPQVLEQLERAGVAIVRVPDEPSLDGARKKIRTIAQAVGGEARGGELIRAMERDLLALRSKLALLSSRPKLKGLFLYLRGTQTTSSVGRAPIRWG